MSTATTATQPLPARIRRTPTAIRVVLIVVVIGYAIFAVGSGVVALLDVAARHTFTAHSTFAGVHRLIVDNSVGDVHLVRARAGAPVSVTAHVTEGLGNPRRTAQRSAGGTLRLSASCANVFVGPSCDVGYTVAVPAGVRVGIESSGGDITVRDYVGRTPLSLSSSAGDIKASGITVPSLQLDSSAGDVRADAIRAPVVHGESSAGDVVLSALLGPAHADRRVQRRRRPPDRARPGLPREGVVERGQRLGRRHPPEPARAAQHRGLLERGRRDHRPRAVALREGVKSFLLHRVQQERLDPYFPSSATAASGVATWKLKLSSMYRLTFSESWLS